MVEIGSKRAEEGGAELRGNLGRLLKPSRALILLPLARFGVSALDKDFWEVDFIEPSVERKKTVSHSPPLRA